MGVIAIRDIPKDTDPFKKATTYELVNFSPSELQNLDSEVKKLINDFFAREEDGKIQIPNIGLNALDISFYMNHSANPNIAYDVNDDFIATRRIKKGEELTIDYSTFSETSLIS